MKKGAKEQGGEIHECCKLGRDATRWEWGKPHPESPALEDDGRQKGKQFCRYQQTVDHYKHS